MGRQRQAKKNTSGAVNAPSHHHIVMKSQTTNRSTTSDITKSETPNSSERATASSQGSPPGGTDDAHPVLPLQFPVEESGAPFPIAALSPAMRGIVEAVANTYGVEIAMPAMEALATMAGAIGSGAQVLDGCIGRITKLNLYVIIAADTGTGKTSANVIAAPLIKASREREDHFIRKIKPALICELKLAKKRCTEIEKLLADGEDQDGDAIAAAEVEKLKQEWRKRSAALKKFTN